MAIRTTFLVFAVCAFTFVAPAQGRQPNIPIVQGFYLLGATQDGRWVSAEDAAPGIGKSVRLKQAGLFSLSARDVTGMKGEEWAACPGQVIVRIDGKDDNDEMPGLFVGSGAAWNLVPRGSTEIRTNSPAYSKVAAEYLRSRGITRSPVKLTQIIEVDLDADGVKEALISGTYYRKEMDLSSGDYSFTIVRYGKGKMAKNLLIDGQFLSKSLDHDLANHRVSGIADVNGDGRMEIALSVTYSESDAQMLFEYNNGRIEKRFEATCGA